MNPDDCPDCGMPAEAYCRCPLGDRACANGHHWHQCYRCSAIRRGESDHAHPSANLCEECAGSSAAAVADETQAPAPKLIRQQRMMICCYIGAGGECRLPATVAVYFGPGPDQYTHACARHVGELGGLATIAAAGQEPPAIPVRLFLIEPGGAAGPEITLR